MSKPKVICLTPVLNEAWILERFLKCASLWADHIIVVDQQSTDGSREIAQRFPKVILVDNPSKTFNEPERQQHLIAEARRIPGPRLLVALDADEFITANVLNSPEWETALQAGPGTLISFDWPYAYKNRGRFSYFQLPKELQVGFVDDGSPHRGNTIHSPRVPAPPGGPKLRMEGIKVMHYCLMDPERVASRLRWYQCWEQLQLKRRPLALYRFYYALAYVPDRVVKPVPPEWIQGYEEQGIDMTSVNCDGKYRWDRDILQFFQEHGTEKFKRLPIWDVDWGRVHEEFYPGQPKPRLLDPRSRLDKLAHEWLRWTQRYYCYHDSPGFAQRLHLRLVEKALRMAGW